MNYSCSYSAALDTLPPFEAWSRAVAAAEPQSPRACPRPQPQRAGTPRISSVAIYDVCCMALWKRGRCRAAEEHGGGAGEWVEGRPERVAGVVW